MFILSPLLYSIPAIVSAGSLLIAWKSGLLRRPLIAFVWFLTALFLQTSGMLFSLPWVVGLILQVALAFYLVLKIMRTNG